MTDERDRIREVERARLAKQLTENPIWSESWDLLNTKLITAWSKTNTNETERREMIYAQLRAAESARAFIEEVITTGKMAEQQLERSSRE